jgi:predicted small lipoprotein YifL
MTRKFRAAPSRRAKAIGWVPALLLLAALAACGHYGPPTHPEPAGEKTVAPAPADPAAPADAPERERHEP